MLPENIFGVYNLVINYGNFVGVLKISNIRKQDGFVLQFDLFKFLKSNQFVLDNIVQQVNINPTDSKLLDRVSSEKVDTVDCNYINAKILRDYIKTTANWAKDTGNNFIDLALLDKLKVTLEIPQLQQIYFLLDAFDKNYFLLESIYNIVNSTHATGMPMESKSAPPDKITNYVPQDNTCDASVQDCVAQQMNQAPKDDFEKLFEYCYNTNLKNLVLHYTLNYYQYISKESVSVQVKDNIIEIKSPNILPLALSMDKSFFYDNIISGNIIPLETISNYASKLIRKVIFDEDKTYINHPTYLMIFNMLILIYSLRFYIELYQDNFDTQYESILSNTKDLQQRLLNHFSTTFVTELNIPPHENGQPFKLVFVLEDFNFHNQWEVHEDEVIAQLAQKESHMLPISHELFIENVITAIPDNSERPKHEFKLSNKKIINIDRLIKQVDVKPQSGFVDVNNEITPSYNEELNLTNYLNYVIIEPNVISVAFKYLNDYAKDPTIVSFIKNFPKEIINLFPVISKDILVPQKLPETINDTFTFYQIVIKNLPRPETIRYTTILFIVFQIIIPYYYYFYNKTSFNDCFL